LPCAAPPPPPPVRSAVSRAHARWRARRIVARDTTQTQAAKQHGSTISGSSSLSSQVLVRAAQALVVGRLRAVPQRGRRREERARIA
jgi:hypothetical protein